MYLLTLVLAEDVVGGGAAAEEAHDGVVGVIMEKKIHKTGWRLLLNLGNRCSAGESEAKG